MTGYLPMAGLVTAGVGEASIDFLDLEGRITPVPLDTVLWIAFVRDFNRDELDPERLTRRTFLARPRTEGLWIRLTLDGGEVLEGLAPLDLGLADALILDRGLYLIPPDVRSNTQRLYVPRSSFTTLEVLAVITTPSRVKSKPQTSGHDDAGSKILPFPEPAEPVS